MKWYKNVSDTEVGTMSNERFGFLAAVWDVTVAKQTVNATRTERDGFASVKEMMKFGGVVSVDESLIPKVDLETPIILVPIYLNFCKNKNQIEDELSGYMPIDGWHRIHKASRVGVEKLPCFSLTKEEEEAIRLM